jgi:WhiB family transcriptional regulator, redox-sensing transcriptional regulator
VTTAPSRAPATRGAILRQVPPADYGHASWRESAACRHVDTELFFPIGKAGAALAETQRAKLVCAGCPVRLACLAFALATRQEYGIWGGYDEDERRELHQPGGSVSRA